MTKRQQPWERDVVLADSMKIVNIAVAVAVQPSLALAGKCTVNYPAQV